MLTDVCSYRVSVSTTAPPSPPLWGQKLLETLPLRHFYIPLLSFEVPLLSAAPRQATAASPAGPSGCLACLLYTSFQSAPDPEHSVTLTCAEAAWTSHSTRLLSFFESNNDDVNGLLIILYGPSEGNGNLLVVGFFALRSTREQFNRPDVSARLYIFKTAKRMLQVVDLKASYLFHKSLVQPGSLRIFTSHSCSSAATNNDLKSVLSFTRRPFPKSARVLPHLCCYPGPFQTLGFYSMPTLRQRKNSCNDNKNLKLA